MRAASRNCWLCLASLLLAAGCGSVPAARAPFAEPERIAGTAHPAPALAPGTLLCYRSRSGRSVDYEVRIQAAPKGFDLLDALARIHERGTVLRPESMSAQVEMTIEVGGFRPHHASATYGVRPTGFMDDLASPQLTDPMVGAHVENLRLLYPLLPDAEVRTGISWSGKAVLHLPIADLPMPLPPVSATTRLTLEAVSGPAAHRVARIALKADSEPGQIVKARLQGTYYVDVTEGRSLGATVTGTVDARTLAIPEPFPITLTVLTAGDGR